MWDLDVSQGGQAAISASRDGTLRLWEIEPPGYFGAGKAPLATDAPAPAHRTGSLVYDFSPQSPRCVALDPDGRTVLVGLDKEGSQAPDYSLWQMDVSAAHDTDQTLLGAPPLGDPTDRVMRRYVGPDP